MKNISYEGYTVREDGKVFGKYGKEIGKANSKGYTYVTINGKQVLRHRLVWLAFVGKIPDGYEIDHIIPIKNGGTDELSNLRLVTHKENCNNDNSISNYKKSNLDKNRKYNSGKDFKKSRTEYQHLYYIKNRDNKLKYMKIYYQIKKQKES